MPRKRRPNRKDRPVPARLWSPEQICWGCRELVIERQIVRVYRWKGRSLCPFCSKVVKWPPGPLGTLKPGCLKHVKPVRPAKWARPPKKTKKAPRAASSAP